MGSHCRSVPPFLTKTYEMVEDASSNEVISWNESGSTFVVWSTADFAKDLLPRYFKHNNFSSFVRQLNTYGFRKTAAERWEFANEWFRRGERELLCSIHRRKSTPSASQKQNDGPPSPSSNSCEDQRSSFTSSPKSSIKNHLSDISDENEKLRKDNIALTSELAEARRQCEGLVSLLCNYFDVDRDKINSIIQGDQGDHLVAEKPDLLQPTKSVGGEGSGEEEECMKLFGVWLKKKRGRQGEEEGLVMRPLKEMKMDCRAPWMRTCPSSTGETSKVCN